MIVVPVYNITALPDTHVYIPRGTFFDSTGREPSPGDKVMILFTKEKRSRSQLSSDIFCRYAVTGEIAEMINPNVVEIITDARVEIGSAEVTSDFKIRISASVKPEADDTDPQEEKRRFENVRRGLMKVAADTHDFEWAKDFINYCGSLADLVCLFSPMLPIDAAEKYALLEKDSLKERAEAMEDIFSEIVEMVRLSRDARSRSESEYRTSYRESAIKKQMSYLQDELDRLHPENVSDIKSLEKKLAAAPMNEEARKEADKVLLRLKRESETSQEYAVLFDYLDFLAGLPWKKEEYREVDIDEAQRILDEDHHGLKSVKRRIIQQIAVMNLRKRQSGTLLLFVGAPGTGKTSIGKSIARAVGRQYCRISLGGVSDEADIRGHRRTYIASMPGRIMDGIAKSGVSNPVVVLDEVDKLSSSYHGEPSSALLEVLDPEQNSSFTDHYLNVPFDLSDAMFICTANTTDTIPAPLLNRMEVIRFSGYPDTEKMRIAREHLIPKAQEESGIPEGSVIIPDETLKAIISDYTMEAGVRGLKKCIDTVYRASAVKLLKNSGGTVTIEKNEIRDYLDIHPKRHEPDKTFTKPGVVTGLAWTQGGGDVLYIETMFTKGSGKLIMTGQLGDVMKESVQIAVSLVKSVFPDKAELFDKNDLHVHVPEGAVPKDGPSAGITLTTALSSLVTGNMVDPELAMTGEVSLRGVVSPIGGLPEKLMAAKRSGISTVLIPAENEDDLRDVADEVKNSLNIIPVTSVVDVLKKTNLLGSAT